MLVTERLMLRPWWDDDFERLAAIHADDAMMRTLGSGAMTRVQSDLWLTRLLADAMRDGFGPWAVEAPRVAPLIGVVGLGQAGSHQPFAPAVEVMWRIGRPWWGRGYAVEAARAAIADVFETRAPAEVVATTAAINTQSRRVMEKLDMTWDPAEDYNHARIAPDHPLSRHVVYRLRRTGRVAAPASGWRAGVGFADGGTVPDR